MLGLKRKATSNCSENPTKKRLIKSVDNEDKTQLKKFRKSCECEWIKPSDCLTCASLARKVLR